MNDQLAAVDPDAPARVLSQARDAYEGPWDFWNGVRTVFSTLSFVALIWACLLREDSGKISGKRSAKKLMADRLPLTGAGLRVK